MNSRPSVRSWVLTTTLAHVLTLGAGTGCAAEVEDDEVVPTGEAEDNVVAIPLASCLANPACAAAVAAAVGFTVYNASQLSGELLRRAQAAANAWEARRRAAACRVDCTIESASGGGQTPQCSGRVSGSGATRQEAQAAANRQIPRGCKAKHCSPGCR
jgi:hypothetical protein